MAEPTHRDGGRPRHVITANALVPSEERGLAADMLTARAHSGTAHPVCTSIVAAGLGRVTDVVNVPEDAVAAQLDHLAATNGPAPIKASVLGSHRIVELVASAVERGGRPFVLDLRLRGTLGEELLSPRGRHVLVDRLGLADLVIAGRRDVEALIGLSMESLDDAQVAAQRLAQRGARTLVIRCGPLPARFFDAQPNGPTTDPYNADLYFDGREFALLEAPQLPSAPPGAADAFAMSALVHLAEGLPPISALQRAKRFVTEAIRQRADASAPLNYFWELASTSSQG